MPISHFRTLKEDDALEDFNKDSMNDGTADVEARDSVKIYR